MAFADFLKLPREEAKQKLLQCCHCERLAELLLEDRSFWRDLREYKHAAHGFFIGLGEKHWLEAFRAHPKIGDVSSLREKYASTKGTASVEQGGVAGASEATLTELKRLNDEYEKKFGFIFIVFATGKSAEQMLTILKERIRNTREQELRNAAEAQAEIMMLRMEKLL